MTRVASLCFLHKMSSLKMYEMLKLFGPLDTIPGMCFNIDTYINTL